MTKLLVLAAVLGFASPVVASPDGTECKIEDASKPVRFHVEIVNGKRTTVIDDEVIVCPKVPRPAVVYVTSPKDVEFSWQSLDQSFLPRIVESLKDRPLSGGTR